jgi:hypothetical protein
MRYRLGGSTAGKPRSVFSGGAVGQPSGANTGCERSAVAVLGMLLGVVDDGVPTVGGGAPGEAAAGAKPINPTIAATTRAIRRGARVNAMTR